MLSPEQVTPALIGATFGAIIGPALALVAAKRATRQPVDFDIAAEQDLLRWIIHSPADIVRVQDLEAEHFASTDHVTLWNTIRTFCAAVPRVDIDADEITIAEAGSFAPKDLHQLLTSQHPHLLAAFDNAVERERGMQAAQYIYDTGRDRIMYPGNSPIVRGDVGEAPLVRRYVAPRIGRHLIAALLTAAAGAISPLLAAQLWPTGLPYLLALAALVCLTVGSVIWALVDQDTMMIDLETFFPLAGVAWVLTLIADIVGGEPLRALSGFLLSLGIAAFFLIINRLYRRFKQATTGVAVDGMGGGDSWLVIATAGVPAALAGEANLWYLCAMSGMVAAITVWLVRWPTPWRISRTTPFAFGPYLALGWILGSWAYIAGFQVI
jgi:hypothetical protein